MDIHAKQKVIMHMDGDAFFVACEVAKNSKLKGLPVVTGQERGIVSAFSYEAKALGIVRGMPIFRVKKEFPQIIILPGDYASYARYSEMMFNIVRRYADDVEEYSIDECFAELTGLDRPLKMSYREIAQRIQKEITDELGLSISVGVGPTKVLAKVASKYKKPNGFTVIDVGTGAHSSRSILAETPIGKIWGIGTQTSIFLKKKGLTTALDFADKSRDWINSNLSKPHEALWFELNGTSVMPIDPNPKTSYDSVQKTRSFHPATNDPVFLLSQLSKHVEDACAKARHFDLMSKYVSIFLKTRTFEYHNYRFTLDAPTNAPEVINDLVEKHFHKVFHKQVLYRTAGVTLHGLVSKESVVIQGDLFGGDLKTESTKKGEKYEIIHKQIDELEEKFGRNIVYLASTHKARIRDRDEGRGTDADSPDRNLLFL
ncbi:MAG: DNA polymerase IV [Patescibacteria group bacterium]